jgi:hypothetical protein
MRLTPKKARKLTALLLILGGLAYTPQSFTQEKIAFHLVASHLEGCSCSVVCTCSMALKHGCSFVIVTAVKDGNYNGVDLKGVKIAAGGLASDRIFLYVDAPELQREAATGLVKGLYGGLGKVEAVRDVKIDLSGKDGRYAVTIDEGKGAQLTTEPVLGEDKKAPVTHINMYPFPLMQVRTVKGAFHEADLSFNLEGSNSFFNNRYETNGKL